MVTRRPCCIVGPQGRVDGGRGDDKTRCTASGGGGGGTAGNGKSAGGRTAKRRGLQRDMDDDDAKNEVTRLDSP